VLDDGNSSEEVKLRTMEYFDFCWRKNIIFDKDNYDFSDLSTKLQQEIMFHIRSNTIKEIPLFEDLDNE
jgi:hypothetical protein